MHTFSQTSMCAYFFTLEGRRNNVLLLLLCGGSVCYGLLKYLPLCAYVCGGELYVGRGEKRENVHHSSLAMLQQAERLYLEYSFFSPFPLALVCECCIISFHVKKCKKCAFLLSFLLFLLSRLFLSRSLEPDTRKSGKFANFEDVFQRFHNNILYSKIMNSQTEIDFLIFSQHYSIPFLLSHITPTLSANQHLLGGIFLGARIYGGRAFLT